MNSTTSPINLHESKTLLGSKISDAIEFAEKNPDFAYEYRRGECHVFENAPFKAVFTMNSIISKIDELKELRTEPRFILTGFVNAVPDDGNNNTITGELINISSSAICIKTHIFPKTSNSSWNLNINLGNASFNITGSIFRKDDENLVFVFTDNADELMHYLQKTNKAIES